MINDRLGAAPAAVISPLRSNSGVCVCVCLNVYTHNHKAMSCKKRLLIVQKKGNEVYKAFVHRAEEGQ
jgi:hypothetical protein